MGTFSPFHWLILLIVLALVVAKIVAIIRILRRLGFSPWWVLLAFVPIANVIGLWNLSKMPWQAVKGAPPA